MIDGLYDTFQPLHPPGIVAILLDHVVRQWLMDCTIFSAIPPACYTVVATLLDHVVGVIDGLYDTFSHSTRLLAATTLRNVLGTRNLAEILSGREAQLNNHKIRVLLVQYLL